MNIELNRVYYFDAVESDSAFTQADEPEQERWQKRCEEKAALLAQQAPWPFPVALKPRPCSECCQEGTCERINYCAQFKCTYGEASQP